MNNLSKPQKSERRKRIEAALAEIDWERIDAMTDEDIDRQIAENPDAARVMTDEEWETAIREGRVKVILPGERKHWAE